MIKVVIFDGDGMVINKPMLFSLKFSKEFNIPYDKILPFFKKEMEDCRIGKADLREELKKYIEIWGWKKSIQELLEYWFESEDYPDERVLDCIKDLQSAGIKCYLATNNEKYRADYITYEMGFGKIFDKVFASAYMGCKKGDRGFWKKVFKELNKFKKSEIMVWDDRQKNIDSAKDFGFSASLYNDFESFEKKVNKLIKPVTDS